MSKSTGNFVTIRELLKSDRFGQREWEGAELRLAMLKTHYRQPLNWTVTALDEAARALDEWKAAVLGVTPGESSPAIVETLGDDLNSPLAVAELHRLARAGETATLAASLEMLGFRLSTYRSCQDTARDRATAASNNAQIDKVINGLIGRRTAARLGKDFKESDRIRDELAGMGVVLKDGKDADGKPVTTWEIAR